MILLALNPFATYLRLLTVVLLTDLYAVVVLAILLVVLAILHRFGLVSLHGALFSLRLVLAVRIP